MFGSDAPAFGVKLTPDNLDERNAQIRADRQRFICEHKSLAPTLSTSATGDGCEPFEGRQATEWLNR
jgi:hypothetical protein